MRDYLIAALGARGFGHLHVLVPTDDSLYALAFLVEVWLFTRRTRAASIASPRAASVVVVGTLGFLLGSRLYYLIIHSERWVMPFHDWWSLEGTASWGGYVGLLGAVFIYGRVVGEDSWRHLDALASCAGLPIAIGRIGCVLNGDDFGRITAARWAVRFPPGSYPFDAHLDAGLISPGAISSLPVHPFQIYLALNGICLFVVGSLAWRRLANRPGMTCLGFLCAYGLVRFVLEFFRDPAAGGAVRGLSTSQVMALGFVGCGALLAGSRLRRPPTRPQRGYSRA